MKTTSEAWPDITALAYNGPYKLIEYKAKDEAVLVRNDNFAGTAANIDKITMKYIDKLDVAENAYRANQVDITRVNLTNLTVVKADPELGKEFIQVPGVTTRAVHMNLNKKPLDNEKVRLALSQATDRETLNKVAFQGAYIPSTTWMPPAVVGGGVTEDSFSKTVGYNPDQAKKTLADAGYADGKGFPTLTITVNDVPGPARHGGVPEGTVEEDPEHRHQRSKSWIRRRAHPSSPARTTTSSRAAGRRTIRTRRTGLRDCSRQDGANNHYGISNPELDDLFQKASFNTNDEERRGQYRKINELLSKSPLLVGPSPLSGELQLHREVEAPRPEGERGPTRCVPLRRLEHRGLVPRQVAPIPPLQGWRAVRLPALSSRGDAPWRPIFFEDSWSWCRSSGRSQPSRSS